ncbi:MAG TPA: hypothetical protein VLE51_02040, partial [Candidatus Saccharimonadales bacterium]|nr:hypothetical protein [Candidatus Saccharimonadales bacterium]
VSRAFCSFLLILVLLSTHFLLAVLMDTEVYAAQLTSRKITLGSSQISATDVTYSVSFFAATTGTIKGIVVQFCNSASTAIIGTACTGPTGFDINKATLVVANQKINGTTVSNAYTIHANSDAHTLIITNATGNSANAGQSVTFDLGSTGGSDGITNSSTTGTFYARMLTYSNNTTASNYTDTSPGTHIDDGSVALSTANQLTTYARVQEQLQFCVGTTTVDDSTTTIANSCAGSFTGSCGTAVNLGVLDSTAVSISPVPVAPGTPGNGNNCNGAAMVLTNASNGVVITYFAEQDTSSGKLKVTGASCSGSSNTDQCFNDSASQSAFTAGTEAFGVTVGGTNCNGTTTTSYSCDMTSGTNVLIASSNYIGNTTTAFGTNNGFAWKDNGTTTQIASSSGPVENETLVLKFAGTPALTTPTGSYQVTTTYIATATF